MTATLTDAAAPAPSATTFAECLVVRLDTDAYAIRLADVAEIHQLVAATPAPDASGGLVGYIDIRGRVVPVLDLRLALGKETRPWDASMHMVLVSTSTGPLAIAVDRVDGVVTVELDAPGRGVLHPAVSAIAQHDRLGLVPVLDPETLLARTSPTGTPEAPAGAGRPAASGSRRKKAAR